MLWVHPVVGHAKQVRFEIDDDIWVVVEGIGPRHFVCSFARENFRGVKSEGVGGMGVKGGYFRFGEELVAVSSKEASGGRCEIDVDVL